MSTIEIFEPALCCNTGVCGDDVDQALVTFSADMDWVRSKGGDIARFNLAGEPLAFAEREPVKAFLQVSGSEGLPLVLVDGVTAQTGRYPDRAQLAKWAGIITDTPDAVAPAAPAGIQMLGLTDTTDAGSCCAPTDNGTSCC
ncbi:arsenite efflux transporter metallochaperone ArsD [Rhodococcus koreensis]